LVIRGFGVKDRPPETQFFDLEELREDLIRTQPPDLYKNKVEPLLNFLHGKYASYRIPVSELKGLQQFAREQVLLTQKEKQKIIDRAAAQGKTIPIESVRQGVEQWMASYDKPDRAAVIEHVDQQLKLLTAKYGRAIPVDEAYKLQQACETSSADLN
jgi:hypothetical protein